jgi:hypothetical protein
VASAEWRPSSVTRNSKFSIPAPPRPISLTVVDETPEIRTPGLGHAETFKTTHWSVVLSAGHDSESVARQALEQLCQAYWFPLYAYVRRQGQAPDDAQDLTQEFFARFLERGAFARADRERGRFRTYLLTSLKRFLQEEWRRANRQKRGGGMTFVPLAGEDAENRYAAEPRDELSPDLLYDRRATSSRPICSTTAVGPRRCWRGCWRGCAPIMNRRGGRRFTRSSSSFSGAGRAKSPTRRWAGCWT